jgi:hypothetical protein
MQFPRKPKRRAQGALRRAPRIVVRRGEDRARIVQRLAHTPQRITDIPRATQRTQAVVAVDVGRRPIAEHLAQRCGEILRIRYYVVMLHRGGQSFSGTIDERRGIIYSLS